MAPRRTTIQVLRVRRVKMLNKSTLIVGLISLLLLSGCGKESDDDGMACGWFEIDGVMKEICI
jgi:hypothetical protein